jgi:subtilisin family serine protease
MRKSLLGSGLRKLHPKLRMVANCSTVVNAVRAERAPSVAVASAKVLKSNVDESSVGSLGCGQRIICVANLDDARERINMSSSQGPTRDGRPKPDVAAPGTDILAAKGFAGPDDLWVSMTGTSMASPYVTGIVGLMLATRPELTAAQIEGIIQRTARPLPGTSCAWTNSSGYGVINPEACLAEAGTGTPRECPQGPAPRGQSTTSTRRSSGPLPPTTTSFVATASPRIPTFEWLSSLPVPAWEPTRNEARTRSPETRSRCGSTAARPYRKTRRAEPTWTMSRNW